jgi:shikimate dehydrogenase
VSRDVGGATRVTGIIGDPVAHSRSPAIHNAAFSAIGLDWVYVAFPVPAGRAAEALAGVRALGIEGLSVTMPHKTDAAAACDELTPTAARLAAVNAVVNRDGHLLGDSTDGEGLVRALAADGVEADGASVLVLGAGGAARAIVLALADAGARVVVAARRPDAASSAADLTSSARTIDFSSIDDAAHAVDVVVNATPLGMQGEAAPFDVASLPEGSFVFDTVYHPAETPLLAAARARGLGCANGLGMLVHQAAVAFELFTGREAPLEAMWEAARRD